MVGGWFSSATHDWRRDSKSNICIQSLNLNVAPAVPTPGGRESTAILGWLKSLLSRPGECLWLSLEGSSQGWWEAGRGWWGCGSGDTAMGAGGGGGWALGTADICIPLSSVTALERWGGGTGAKRSRGFGRTVAEVQESKMECYKIFTSLVAAWPLRTGTEILKIKNAMSDSKWRTTDKKRGKEGGVNTLGSLMHFGFLCKIWGFSLFVCFRLILQKTLKFYFCVSLKIFCHTKFWCFQQCMCLLLLGFLGFLFFKKCAQCK